MSTTPEAPQDCKPLCYREKYWSELDDKEKVERLRTVLKRLKDDVESLSSRFRKTEYAFNRHNHSHQSGAPTVPVYDLQRGDPQSCWENESLTRKTNSDGDDCYI